MDLVLEIQFCERAVALNRCRVVGARGFFRSRKAAEIFLLFADAGPPRIGGWLFCPFPHALEGLGTVFLLPAVPHIFRMSANAKVAAPVVQPVSIYMVNVLSELGARNEPVHQAQGGGVPTRGSRVLQAGFPRVQGPALVGDEASVRPVNYCCIPVCQEDGYMERVHSLAPSPEIRPQTALAHLEPPPPRRRLALDVAGQVRRGALAAPADAELPEVIWASSEATGQLKAPGDV